MITFNFNSYSIDIIKVVNDETYKSKCDLCLETFELLTVAEKSNFNGCIYHLGFNVNFRKTVALEKRKSNKIEPF